MNLQISRLALTRGGGYAKVTNWKRHECYRSDYEDAEQAVAKAAACFFRWLVLPLQRFSRVALTEFDKG
jgi:hypothetical protein